MSRTLTVGVENMAREHEMQYSKPELEELGSIFQLTNVASGSGMGSVIVVDDRLPEKRADAGIELSDGEMDEMLRFGIEDDS